MAEPDFATFAVATEPGGAEAEIFEPIRRHLGAQSLGVNRLELQPRQRLRVHRHEHQEEIYLVLSGTLTVILEEAEHEVPVGTLARVGPSVRRQVANRGEEPVVVLAFGAAGEHVSRDALAWGSWEEDGPGRSPAEVPLPPDFDA
jgi:mannose-6-phosphate isomerase-like protein (cupin superfamily)